MTGYFDEATREVSTYASVFRDDDKFLEAVADTENRVIADVSLCTGDREFPGDLRKRMQTAIACLRVESLPCLPPTRGREYALACRGSQLISELHSLFHELARRRLTLRFGIAQDSPRQFLVSRAEWERERFGEDKP